MTNPFLVSYTYRYCVILEYLHFIQKKICFFKTCLRFVWGYNLVERWSCLYTTQSLWQLSQKAGCYIIDQGCRNFGTRAQNGTRNDFLCTRQSLLSQTFLFLLPDHRLYTVNNTYTYMYMCMYMYICICIYIYTHTSDTVQTVHELPLLPNNTAVKHFCTNRSGAK